MTERKGRGGRVLVLREAVDELVVAPPQLVELSADREREAVRLLAELFAQAARRGRSSQLRQAA
jgi:hypothetical protein